MSEERSARDNTEGAPLLPGGEPELAGTGPQGAYTADDGSVSPEDQHPEYDQPSGATTTDGTPSPAVNDVDSQD